MNFLLRQKKFFQKEINIIDYNLKTHIYKYMLKKIIIYLNKGDLIRNNLI